MPTYVYRCLQCEQRFEVQQSFTDGPATTCAVCGQGPVKKVFTPVGVTFKGSGFYKTDSRSGAAANGATAGSEARDRTSSTAGGESSGERTSATATSSASSGAEGGTGATKGSSGGSSGASASGD